MNLFTFQRIATDQLPELIRFMSRSSLVWAHLIKTDLRARFCSLKRSLAARKASPDDMDSAQNLF